MDSSLTHCPMAAPTALYNSNWGGWALSLLYILHYREVLTTLIFSLMMIITVIMMMMMEIVEMLVRRTPCPPS